MKLEPELAKKISLEDAIDVFKYKGKKYSVDEEEYRNEIPHLFAKDYKHVCRFSKKKTEQFFNNNYYGSFDPTVVSDFISSRKEFVKDFVHKNCTHEATRLKEPDMICYYNNYNDPECRFLKSRTLEAIYEVGGGKYSWASPYYGNQDKMIPQPWKDLLYHEGSSLQELKERKEKRR